MAIAVGVTSGLASLLLVPVLIQKRKKIAFASLVASILITTLLCFINVLIWPSPNPPFSWLGQGLCDVEVKLFVALYMVVDGSLLCLYRQVSVMLDPSRFGVQPSPARKRWNRTLELTFCVGIPCLRMILVYIVQPDRYWIVGIHGCTPTVDHSLPSFYLFFTWPVIVTAISLFWAGLATYRMARHYRGVAQMLGDTPTGKEKKLQLIKIYIFTTIIFLVNTPSVIYLFYSNILPQGLQPYSWSRVHPPDWSERIGQAPIFPFVLIGDFTATFFSLVMFACFGLDRSARKEYRKWWQRLRWSSKSRKTKSRVPSTDEITRTTFLKDGGVCSREINVHELEAR